MKLIGTGSYLPFHAVDNKLMELIVDTDAKWIEQTLGIKERRIKQPWESTSDLASLAADAAIRDSGLTTEDIDLIIVATSTPDHKAPSTAAIVQHNLGLGAVAFDINAVCSGFIYGMEIANAFLEQGIYYNVLLIGADTFSTITDWNNRNAVFFGDGAGAAVFTNGGNFWSKLYTDGKGKDGFVADDYFRMKGKEVYNAAISHLPEAIDNVLFDSRLVIEDIDVMIPHQPSIQILKETARVVGLPWEKVKTNMDRYANTAAATIPILLDEVKPKGNVLFAAMGSGWTYGAAIMKI